MLLIQLVLEGHLSDVVNLWAKHRFFQRFECEYKEAKLSPKKHLTNRKYGQNSLSQKFGHDPLLFNPRQLLVKSLKLIGESFVVDSHAMENGCI